MLPSLELLESRIAPAGIITLEENAFGYILSGDAQANDLVISQDGLEITLTPQGGTQILNKFAGETVASTVPVTIRLMDDSLSIRMGDGADVLALEALTLPSDLNIEMGFDTSADALTISDKLHVGGDLSVVLNAGTASISADVLHVAYSANIVSFAETFTVTVGSFYVGEDLSVMAAIRDDGDTFTLNAVNFFVYDDFALSPNVLATNAPLDAVSVNVGSTLSVGGNLQVVTNGIGDANVVITSDTMILSEKVIVANNSGSTNKELSLHLGASVIRMDGGLSVTSKSLAPSQVSLETDLVIIDGPVSVKLPKSAGELRILSETLQIGGNVNFATKGAGTLQIEGGGDIYGNVTASLGSGTGEVALTGAVDRPLIFGGLKVSAPGKNVPSLGIGVLLQDVSAYGKVSLLLGRGADLININDAVFRSAVTLSTGDGADTVNIHTEGSSISEFRKGLGVLLGGGDDALTLGRAEAYNFPSSLLLYGPKAFNGGTGTDSYLASGRNVKFYKSFPKDLEAAPVVRAFES